MKKDIKMTVIKRALHRFLYKHGSKNVHWVKIISVAVVVAGFAVFVLFNNARLSRLKKERDTFPRYTIGFTTGEHNNIRGSMVVDYVFFYRHHRYENSNSTKDWLIGKPKTKGGRYFVWFASINPENAALLFDLPVPEKIQNAPDSVGHPSQKMVIEMKEQMNCRKTLPAVITINLIL